DVGGGHSVAGIAVEDDAVGGPVGLGGHSLLPEVAVDPVKCRWKKSSSRSGMAAVRIAAANIWPKSTPVSWAKSAMATGATRTAGAGAMSSGHRKDCHWKTNRIRPAPMSGPRESGR